MQKRTVHHTRGNLKEHYYVDGNTVRRLDGEPAERRRRQIEKEQAVKKHKNRRMARRNQERALRFSLSYVLFCTVALALFGAVCVAYIQIQSGITSRMKRIGVLETQVMDLRADNDAAMKRIGLSVDLDAVKEKAIEYGMKYAQAGQIIYYSVEDSDYMDQHSDIPEK